MITVKEARVFVRADECEEEYDLLSGLIAVANEYMKSAVGKNYKADGSREKLLSLMVIKDLYDNRGTTEKIGSTVRKLVDDFSLQIKLELRGEQNVTDRNN